MLALKRMDHSISGHLLSLSLKERRTMFAAVTLLLVTGYSFAVCVCPSIFQNLSAGTLLIKY